MSKGKFYSVGVGPGDPGLMTVKAIDTIKKCGVICVPQSGGKNIALDIAADYVCGKEIVFCDMPMTKDKNVLEESHNKAAVSICSFLESSHDVAFLCLGDPTVYSTTSYIHKKIMQMGFECEIIPGVTSFCAAAARLNISLCEGGEPLHVVPASHSDIDEFLSLSGTKIFMKSGKQFADVKHKLSKLNGHTVMMVERATMEGEKIYRSIGDVDEPGYFSLIVVKDERCVNVSGKHDE